MDGGGSIKQATIYRMVMDKHICPYGLQAKDLLEREGFTVDDHWLRTPEETDAFKREHHVETKPQVFIGGKRIGRIWATPRRTRTRRATCRRCWWCSRARR